MFLHPCYAITKDGFLGQNKHKKRHLLKEDHPDYSIGDVVTREFRMAVLSYETDVIGNHERSVLGSAKIQREGIVLV